MISNDVVGTFTLIMFMSCIGCVITCAVPICHRNITRVVNIIRPRNGDNAEIV